MTTDAPLFPDQCQALARRVTLGLARTGTTGSHFSGDLFLASRPRTPVRSPRRPDPVRRGLPDEIRFVPWGYLDPFYEAVVQATEEAVVDSLVANSEMIGFRGHRTPALPRDRLVKILKARGAIV